jgi:hypothetical protein
MCFKSAKKKSKTCLNYDFFDLWDYVIHANAFSDEWFVRTQTTGEGTSPICPAYPAGRLRHLPSPKEREEPVW